jgi:diguanylate cyclase (GGDEF)-like protein
MQFSTCHVTHGAPSTVDALIADSALWAVFQPIVRLADGEIAGHEGLIRGPAETSLATPRSLFAQAQQEGSAHRLEIAAARVCCESFARLEGAGLLFINASAAVIETSFGNGDGDADGIATLLGASALLPERVVIELTEQSVITDHERFDATVRALRSTGAAFALDDYGSANASMNLWVRLAPGYVKIDRFFIDNIALDPLKFEAVKTMAAFARATGAELIAEGIERPADLGIVRDLGIAYGQGFLLGRPAALPGQTLPIPIQQSLRSSQITVYPSHTHTHREASTSGFELDRMLILAPSLPLDARNDHVVDLFNVAPDLHAVAIIDDGRPVALINRRAFMDQYALPYHRELFGKRPCLQFANPAPLVVERYATLEQVAHMLANDDLRYLSDGLIITDAGRYVGLATGERLVRAVTEIRLEAARYANPLTFLPGNVPINSHVERLIDSGVDFVACYVDLDDFKPFNDYYGYWQGDEVLKAAAAALRSVCEPACDFLGHIGGDDFLMLFQSADWHSRSLQAITRFNEEVKRFYSAEDRLAGGIYSEDRSRRRLFFGFVTMSVGAVRVAAGTARISEEIGAVAAIAKRRVKKERSGMVAIDFAHHRSV